MSGGINSYRFKIQRKRTRGRELGKHKKLVQQLDQLDVKVNQPEEMSIEHLELLVNHHRTTVEARISKEQLEVAEANGLSKDDVQHRVEDLNWDARHAVAVKKVKETRVQRRARRQVELALMIEKLNAEETAK